MNYTRNMIPSWRSLWFLLVIAVTVGFFGCDRQKTDIRSAKKIVIIKYVPHPALDELEKAFIETIGAAPTQNPSDIPPIERHNANGNPQRAKQLAEIATRSDVALIVAIATPAAQAVAKTESKIPLLYGAVADPEGAEIIPSDRATGIKNAGPNVVGRAVAFLKLLKPNLATIGTLYNPSEQNSVYVQRLLQDACATHNVKLIQRQVKDAAQISNLAQDMSGEVQVFYSANDNTVNAGITSFVAVADATKIPLVIGDLSTLSKGPVAAVGFEYSEMGRELAGMALELLSGKAVSDVPPRDAAKPEIWLNAEAFERIGLQMSPEVRESAQKIVVD